MNKIYSALVFFFIISFSLQKEGHMGDAIINNISLENLVKMSDYILVVKNSVPFVRNIEIDITPENEIADKGKYPPYILNELNYVVDNILYASPISKNIDHKEGISIKKKDNINVLPAEHKRDLKYHKAYYIEGKMVSPILTRYENYYNLENEEKVIIFLKVDDYGKLSFSVMGAKESIKNIRSIKNYIKKIK